MEADEVRLLKKLHTESADSRFVFMTERKAPMTADGFLKLLARLGKVVGFTFKTHPHMLRHGAGHALASANVSTRTIQAMLGHKNIQHTVRYTTISNPAFVGLGKKIGGKV
jgi:type 1 fimbriae regulatory protein FimB/type 1 fimbriae regulatory protein FimE